MSRIIAVLSFALVIPSPALSQSSEGARSPAEPIEKLTHPRFSYPTWSPDGRRILYESSVSGDWEIYVMDLDGLGNDGGNIVQLTHAEGNDRMPSWSPDGNWIAFVSDRDGDFDVYRMRSDGSQATRLTDNDLPEIHPYWMPDGSQILFNRLVRDERLYAIWSTSPDGADQREILRDDELNSYAQMSPDGAKIVFDKWVGNDEENGEIYVLHVKTGRLDRLTENDVYDGYPAWFPDGEWIVYSSEVGDDFKLFRIRADGMDRRQLTTGPGSDARAHVSPDGRRIVFNREIDDNINIHVLTLEE